MFGLLNSIVDLTTNVVKVVVAPVEVVATLANAAVKPVAEVVTDLVQDIKDTVK